MQAANSYNPLPEEMEFQDLVERDVRDEASEKEREYLRGSTSRERS